MVHWEATPGSVILDLIDHVNLDDHDVFIDLGSGLGNIAMLVNLLTGLRSIGIERDPVFYKYAEDMRHSLALHQVSFINADARDADLSQGTVFYLFTPFIESILHKVMNKIYHVSEQHPVTVCSFGPCTPVIASLPWMRNIKGDSQHEFQLVIFKAGEDSV
jgi:predicted RNA methylase